MTWDFATETLLVDEQPRRNPGRKRTASEARVSPEQGLTKNDLGSTSAWQYLISPLAAVDQAAVPAYFLAAGAA